MPGKKKVSSQADEAMMRACWDHQADMFLGAGVVTSIQLFRTPRKGCYNVRLAASGDERVWSKSTTEVIEVEWPRSEVITLAAAIFQAMVKLDLQVGEAIAAGWEHVEPWGY
jgi:hypothetical protein